MWSPGTVTARLDGIAPLVAQWEKATHPAQVRLNDYLGQLTSKLSPLPDPSLPLFLHLHVRAKSSDELLRHYDLENYLTPLFGRRWLNPNRFNLVIGTKDASSPSQLTIGIAIPNPDAGVHAGASSDWVGCTMSPGCAPSTKDWKEQLRQALAARESPLPDSGPVHARFVVRCSANRNWTSLWKSIGDAMGPVLGYTLPEKLYHPRDDRIVRLELHRMVDADFKNRVEVKYAWRMAVDDRHAIVP